MLEVINLNVNRGKQEILKQVSFQVNECEIVGLVGPNGAGKSTLIKTLSGVIHKKSGTIECDGISIERNRIEYLNKIQVCFDRGAFYPQLTGKENLMQIARVYGIQNDEVDNCIREIGLWKKKDIPVSKYSFGMIQRLNIAQVLLTRKPYILLDEPLNGIDPEGVAFIRKVLMEMRERYSCSIVVSSHLLGELKNICDRIVFFKNGCVVESIDMSNKEMQTYVISVDLIQKAVDVLASFVCVRKYEENSIRLDGDSNDLNNVLRALIENGIQVSRVETYNDIERIYINKVGGECDVNK